MNTQSSPRSNVISHLTTSTEGRAQLLIRLAVGLIFFTQGILKYTDPHMGVLRFARIGFPFPDSTAHFVGTFEIVCGLLVLNYRYSGCIVEAGGEESDGAARRSRLPSLVVVVSSRFHEPNTHRPATNLD
jgi:hypothetical protein